VVGYDVPAESTGVVEEDAVVDNGVLVLAGVVTSTQAIMPTVTYVKCVQQ
jgi:hypothetical protein